MKATTSRQPRLPRCRRKAPMSAARTMDLLGMDTDGALYLWEANAQVQPLSAFPMKGQHIVSGHYVIEVRGAAVTVHCGNTVQPGQITLQYMCRNARSVVVARTWLAPSLLGRVLKDERDDTILAMLRQMTAEAVARQQAPHRRRGQA